MVMAEPSPNVQDRDAIGQLPAVEPSAKLHVRNTQVTVSAAAGGTGAVTEIVFRDEPSPLPSVTVSVTV